MRPVCEAGYWIEYVCLHYCVKHAETVHTKIGEMPHLVTCPSIVWNLPYNTVEYICRHSIIITIACEIIKNFILYRSTTDIVQSNGTIHRKSISILLLLYINNITPKDLV